MEAERPVSPRQAPDPRLESGRNAGLSAALCLYGQMLMGLCLFLTERTGTPGYLSILLTLPLTAGALFLSRRAMPRKGVLNLLPALVFWTDGLIAFYGLCALGRALLPDHHPWLIAFFVALAAFPALAKGENGPLLMSRPVLALTALPLAYCAVFSLSQGQAGHLFPLLGEGGNAIGGGAVWMLGCAASACLPDARGVSQPDQKNGMVFPPRLAAVLAAAATALLYAFLLPGHALARQSSLPGKLTLLTSLSSPPAGWPLLLSGLLTLLLYALLTSLTRALAALGQAGKKRISLRFSAGVMLLVMLPLGACQTRTAEGLLLWLAPARSGAALLYLAVRSIRKTPGKEKESPCDA